MLGLAKLGALGVSTKPSSVVCRVPPAGVIRPR